jgi:UDP-N-acetylmuramoylalanine--D-glutamate ligase
MKIAIVGFDVEGKATYDYLVALGGHEITVCDQNTAVQLPAGVASQLGDSYLDGLDAYDVIVRTPGLHPYLIIEKNPGVEERITSHINLFYGGTPTRNIIGVTGTKGKGTTSSLITAILHAAGKDVHLGGNIGVPPLTFVRDLNEDSYVVLELSSFQLIDCRYSPQVGVCLMIAAEHLNWHADMSEYVAAKEQLFAHQQTDDVAVYNADNDLSYQIASAGLGQTVPYMSAPGAAVENGIITIDGQDIVDVTELKLLGKHNWQNACAAVTAVWQAGIQDAEVIRGVLKEFSGLPYRLEFVRELDGVKYYNDSFGTTPETAIVAIEAFEEPKIVILGGSDKGADYAELARTVASEDVRKVVLIGEQAERIQKALADVGFTDVIAGGATMKEIVDTTRSAAEPGSVVLLSTACASFDMFENYKDRGNQFNDAVKVLAEAGEQAPAPAE